MKPSDSSSSLHLARLAMGTALGAVLLATAVLLAGCPSQSHQQASVPAPQPQAAAFGGVIFGGRQPIIGATVVAYAAGTSVGAMPVEIGSDTTDSNGRFTISFAPTPATGQIVYVTANGGDATGSGSNAAIYLLTIAGAYCTGGSDGCAFPDNVNLTELTTVASTSVLQDYIQFVDCSTVGGTTANGICLAIPGAAGLSQAVKTFANLVNVATGKPSDFLSAQTAGSPLYATLERLNTLADALASCVNTVGSVATPSGNCQALFAAALDLSTDTLQTAFLAASNPIVNQRGQAFFDLASANPVFAPVATTAPADWTIGGGHFAFVANSGGGDISVYRLTPMPDGILDPIAGNACASPPFSDPHNCIGTGAVPGSIAMDPTGRYVYVTNSGAFGSGGNDVSAFRRNADINHQGSLSPIPGVTCNGNPSVTNCFPAGNDPESAMVDASGHYLYVVNSGGHDVSGYKILGDGTLQGFSANPCKSAGGGTPPSPNPDNCLSVGNSPAAGVADPKAPYVYFTVRYGDGYAIAAFTVGTDGVLAPIAGGPCGTSPDPMNCSPASVFANGPIAVDPSGLYLYAANGFANDVSVWAIAPPSASAPGAPIPVAGSPCLDNHGNPLPAPNPDNCFAAGNYPARVGASPNGRYVYVADQGAPFAATAGHYVSAYAVAPSGASAPGALAPITTGGAGPCGTATPDPMNCFASGAAPGPVIIDPSGHTVYVVNTGGPVSGTASAGISAYTIGGFGALDPVAGSPCPYVTGADNCVAAGPSPGAGVVDPVGRNFYAVNEAGDSVSAYTLDLGPVPVPISANPCLDNGNPLPAPNPDNCFPAGSTNWLAVSPNGRYLYADGLNGLYAWVISPDGQLFAIPGSPFEAAGYPQAIAVDPTSQFIYDTSGGTNIKLRTVDPDTGVLVNPQTFSIPNIAQDLAITPNGHFLYTAAHDGGTLPGHDGDAVGMFAIGTGASLAPLPGTVAGFGQQIFAIAMDPNGGSLYALNFGGQVQMLGIGASGKLFPLKAGPCDGPDDPYYDNCVAAGYFPWGLVVDPAGRYLFVINSQDISAFTIDDGYLDSVAGSGCRNVPTVGNCFAPTPAGVYYRANKSNAAEDPTGKYLYVLRVTDPSTIRVFAIGPGGTLAPAAVSTVGAGSGSRVIVTGP